MKPAEHTNSKIEVAVFGGGCFWCTEAIFKMLRGVVSVMPGYAGGSTLNPTYEDVSGGRTGHAEVTRVEFDAEKISYDDLLTLFFATHDPTSLNRQGADIGTEYRSAIFYTTDGQKELAGKYIKDLERSASGGRPIVTEVKPLEKFYPAEDYHQNYYATHKGNPYCELVIDPKLDKVREKFKNLLAENEN